MRAALAGALRARDGVRLLGPLGFENAYALAMRGERARALGIASLDDLAGPAPRLRLGADLEFLTRPEWRAVREAYGLRFAEQRSFSPTFMYRAIADGSADVISAFSSDGRIAALDLAVLADPRRALPSYDAVLLVSPRPRRGSAAGRGLEAAGRRDFGRADARGEPDGRPRRGQEDAGRGCALARPGRALATDWLRLATDCSERLPAQHLRIGGEAVEVETPLVASPVQLPQLLLLRLRQPELAIAAVDQARVQIVLLNIPDRLELPVGAVMAHCASLVRGKIGDFVRPQRPCLRPRSVVVDRLNCREAATSLCAALVLEMSR
jgi:hypothetical protein